MVLVRELNGEDSPLALALTEQTWRQLGGGLVFTDFYEHGYYILSDAGLGLAQYLDTFPATRAVRLPLSGSSSLASSLGSKVGRGAAATLLGRPR